MLARALPAYTVAAAVRIPRYVFNARPALSSGMRAFWGFLAGFLGSLFGVAAFIQVLSGGLLSGFALTDPTHGPQVLQILVSCSFFFGLVTALTVHTRQNADTLGLGSELKEGLGHFSKALLLLRHRAFLPLWISLFLALAGCLMLRGILLGALPLLAGQAFWFFSRGRLLGFLDSKAVPVAFEAPLRAIVHAADALLLLALAPVVHVLSLHGDIDSRLSVMATSLALGFTAVYFWRRKSRGGRGAPLFFQGLFASLWTSLLLLTLNYSLDIRPAVQLGGVTKRDCIDRRTKILAGEADGTAEPGLFLACSQLDPPGVTHQLDDIAVTNEYFGALGFRWRRYYVQPATTQ